MAVNRRQKTLSVPYQVLKWAWKTILKVEATLSDNRAVMSTSRCCIDSKAVTPPGAAKLSRQNLAV